MGISLLTAVWLVLAVLGLLTLMFFMYALGWTKHARYCKKLLEENNRCVTCHDLSFVESTTIGWILALFAAIFFISSGVLLALALFLEGHIVLSFAIAEALLIVFLLLKLINKLTQW